MPELPFDPPKERSLEGETVVFAGKLWSFGRKDARAIVEELGGSSDEDVTVRTTLIATVFSARLETQFTLPKLLVIRAFAPVLAGFWLVRFRHGETRPLPRAVLAAAVALAVWWVVSTMMAVHRPTAIDGVHGRYNGLWNQWILLSMGLIVASTKRASRTCRAASQTFRRSTRRSAASTTAGRLGTARAAGMPSGPRRRRRCRDRSTVLQARTQTRTGRSALAPA